jgi:hypothetical protein
MGVVVHIYNPSTREVKAGGSFRVPGQPRLHNKMKLKMKKKEKKKEEEKWGRSKKSL